MSAPRSIAAHEFTFGGLTLRCHVLDNGERVIEEDSFVAFIDWLENGPWVHPEDPGLRAFARWQADAIAATPDGRLLERE